MDVEDALTFAVQAAKDAAASAEKAAAAANQGPDAISVLERLPGPLFALFALIFIVFNWRSLAGLVDRLSGFEAMGIKVQLAAGKELSKAVNQPGANVRVKTTISGEEKKIKITEDEERRAIKRASAATDVLKDRTILWVDDIPQNNVHEVRTFEKLGLDVIQVQTNDAAINRVKLGEPTVHVLLSDISRPEGNASGLQILDDLRSEDIEIPVIFYITRLDENEDLPKGAFGLTNRPDELLHLVIDALERIRPLR